MYQIITKTILDILIYRGQYQPAQQAYIFLQNGEIESGSLTYGELDRQARAIAAHLQSWQGERALLLYPSGLEFIKAFFGCLYAGVVAVPVYPPRHNQKLSRLFSIVNDAQAKLALTTTSIFADIEKRWKEEAELAHLKLVATDTIGTHPQEFVTKSVTPESLAFLQYTSGSTGTPKGVMVTHGSIIHNQQLIHQAFGHSEKTIFVGWLPLFHDMGLIGNVLHPIYLGVPSILMPPLAFLMKPIRWLQVISKYRATTSGGPNFAYDLCVKKIPPEQLTDLDLSSWDLAFNGAEPVRAETLEQFGQKFAECGFNNRAFYPCYGMAETTLFATGGDNNQLPVIQRVKTLELEQNLVVESEITSPESRVFVGVGRPDINTMLIIANPELLIRCEKGQVGEIWVSGGSVASGYWNHLEATQKTFQAYLKDTGEGPFLRTGDLGFFSNGELFITGRLKDVIIIYGRNHYPQDIELSVEKSHPAMSVNCAAAFSIEVEREERLIVVQEVERTYLHQLNQDEIVEAINQAVLLEHELAIHTIVLLKPASIPKTSSGKIQRSACRQKFLDGSLPNVVFTKSIHKIPPQFKGRDDQTSKKVQQQTINSLKENLSLANLSNAVIAQIPNADTITAQTSDDAKTIGSLDPTIVGDEYELDELLRCQTSNIEFQFNFDTSFKFNNKETERLLEMGDSKSLENNVIYDVDSIRDLIKYRLAQKLNIDATSIKSHATFASYGIDSFMAIELIQSLENDLHDSLDATLLWNFSNAESLAQYLAQSRQQTQEFRRENNGLLQKDKLENSEWIEGEI